MQSRALEKRPIGITIVAVLFMAGGISSIGLGAIVLLYGDPTIGIFMVPVGAFTLFVSYGLLKGEGWAWKWAVIAYVIGIAFAVIDILMGSGGGSGIAIAINGMILYYFTWSTTREYFGHAKKIPV